MTRVSENFLCTACNSTVLQWVGRCPQCSEWNTLVAIAADLGSRATTGGRATTTVVPLRHVDSHACSLLATGVSELDRVLAGGLVGGSATLVYGPPGVGKSTLLFQVLAAVAASGVDVVLASAEESLAQVSGRALRIGPVPDHLLALEGHDVGAIERAIARHRPALAVVDSIQSIADPELPQAAGSLAQVRACVERLTRLAKTTGVPIVMVGHVTKDGDLAGPRAIEHLVDTVLSFEGDRHHALRVLTAVKHRFGSTGEVGIFEMRDDGLRAVPDPGPLLLGDRMTGVAGSVVVPVLQGRRPLLVEVQALLSPSGQAGGRPRAVGIDPARVALLLAVLGSRAGLMIGAGTEVFVAAVGGITITEPAGDLAVILAIASAYLDHTIPPDMVAFGELGLAGELRTVAGTDRRLAEAQRAGFNWAIVPESTPDDAIPPGFNAYRVRTLSEAIAVALVDGQPGTMPPWLTAAASR
jgi:DNA repair protein RadA/Sms